jgi:CDP-glucose 4,6-dehydratase
LRLSESYNGRKVLITGHTGFKGGWLAIYLKHLGATVIGYSLPPPTNPSLFVTGGLKNRITHIEADIRDTTKFAKTIREYRPDIIFHLAAQPLVLNGYATPVETFDVNVMGTISILEAVRQTTLSCAIVAVTTDKVYENRETTHGYQENDALGGYDPYSASKAAAEIAIACYRQSFFPGKTGQDVRLASARAGNVVGGGDWSENRIVPDIVRALIGGRATTLRNPNAIRPWQHVLEPLAAYMLLGAQLMANDGARFATAWNFGPLPGDACSVRDLAAAFYKAWGNGEAIESSSDDAPHEAAILKLLIDKAVENLGWRPVWTFSETVTRTAQWYRRVTSRPADAFAACTDDVQAFEASARSHRLPWI